MKTSIQMKVYNHHVETVPGYLETKEHRFRVKLADMPQYDKESGKFPIPTDPNPRPETAGMKQTSKVAAEIVKTMLNKRPDILHDSLHIMNAGVKLFVDSVSVNRDATGKLTDAERNEGCIVLDIVFNDYSEEDWQIGDGCYDGLTTLACFWNNQDGARKTNNYLNFFAHTGIDQSIRALISKAQNSHESVDITSLGNLESKFDWLKEVVTGMNCEKIVGFHQKDSKAKRSYSAQALISLEECVNPVLYPPEANTQPSGYNKTKHVENYIKNFDAFLRGDKYEVRPDAMRHIMHQVMYMSEWMNATLSDEMEKSHPKMVVNKSKSTVNKWDGDDKKKKSSSRGACNRQTKATTFHFCNEKRECVMTDGAMLPIIGSLRVMIELDSVNGYFRWKYDFETVKQMWLNSVPEVANYVCELYDELPEPRAWADLKRVWSTMARTVKTGSDAYLANQMIALAGKK